MPSGPPWDRKGPCASPIPTRPASVVSLTMSSLTRLIVEVDVRTGCGKGADRKYVSSALIFIAVPLRGGYTILAVLTWSRRHDHERNEETMRTMAAGEFKARCLRVMEEVKKHRAPVMITKKG